MPDEMQTDDVTVQASGTVVNPEPELEDEATDTDTEEDEG